MNFDISYYTSVGGRQNNEDTVSVKSDRKTLLTIVADGLGGHADGEIASGIAAQVLNDELIGAEFSMDVLASAVEIANLEVLQKAETSSMKTTAAVVWASRDKAYIATVGDTRVYFFRGGEILFQSVDHSVSQISVMAGEITAEQIRGHKDRNKLIRVLGDKEDIKGDISDISIQSGDAFLLCSDGFWENIVEDDMLSTLTKSKSSEKWLSKMKKIVDAAADDDCDNNSAIAVLVK